MVGKNGKGKSFSLFLRMLGTALLCAVLFSACGKNAAKGEITMERKLFDASVYQDDAKSMLEKHNITKLLEYERYCRDMFRFDEQKECYAKESRVRITWYDGDGREFVERSKTMSEGSPHEDGLYSTPRHKIYNTLVWLNGDKAVAEMQCMMGGYHTIDGVEYHRLGWARLLYRVVKEEGVWKVAGLDCIYERDMLIPVVAQDNVQIDPKEFEKYRPSYKCVSWLFEKTGLPCSQDLPGDDKPETVQKLYDETSEWLYGKTSGR